MREECGAAREDTVNAVLETPAGSDEAERTAELFRAFADPTRVRILCVLDRRELCVCGVAQVLGMTKSAVSHQLRFLRESGLIRNRKSGREVYYALADDHVKGILKIAEEHLHE